MRVNETTCECPADLANALVPSLIGWAATIIGAFTYIPQAIVTIQTHDFKGVSTITYLLHLVSNAGWLVYGLILNSIVLWASVVPSTICAILILVIYWRDKCQRYRVNPG